jgi:hypothetical protein
MEIINSINTSCTSEEDDDDQNVVFCGDQNSLRKHFPLAIHSSKKI